MNGSIPALVEASENYNVTSLDSIKPKGRIFNQLLSEILNEIKEISKGDRIFTAWRIKGYFGSGKTLLARLIARRCLKEFKNIIPLHIFLVEHDVGRMDFDLFKLLELYVADLYEKVGSRDEWGKKLEILSDSINKVKERIESEDLEINPVDAFLEAMKELNAMGYYPIVILDEFEAMINLELRGVDAPSDRLVENFATFLENLHSIIRGFRYKGALIVLSAKEEYELIDEIIKSNPSDSLPIHWLERLGARLGRNLISNPANEFPFYDPRIYSVFIKPLSTIEYTIDDFKEIAKEVGLEVDEDVLKRLYRVLGTPRAIGMLAKRLKENNISKLDEKALSMIFTPNLHRFGQRIKMHRTPDGKLLITRRAKWFDRFLKLIENGLIYIRISDANVRKRLVEIFGGLEELFTERKLKNLKDNPKELEKAIERKLVEIVVDLEKKGLLVRLGPGEYGVREDIISYLLGLPKTASGDICSLERICERVSQAILLERSRRRESSSREGE